MGDNTSGPVILFPGDYFDPHAPDALMEEEFKLALADPRVEACACGFDAFLEGHRLEPSHPLEGGTRIGLWRGWMMSPEEYKSFFRQCASLGLRLTTTPAAYELTHCFPNAYRYLDPSDTPHIEVFGDVIDAEVVNRTFDAFMVKDHVKSLKQTDFPAVIETPITQERCTELSKTFIRERGELYTGGLVCKQFVHLRRRRGATNEWRAFFLYGSLLDLSPNSGQPTSSPAPDEGLVERASHLESPFYTVDFGELEDGGWTILETGDGQVSGLSSGASAERFMHALVDGLVGEDEQRSLRSSGMTRTKS